MSTVQIIGAVIGLLIICATIWQIIKNGIANSNGKLRDPDPMELGDGMPPG